MNQATHAAPSLVEKAVVLILMLLLCNVLLPGSFSAPVSTQAGQQANSLGDQAVYAVLYLLCGIFLVLHLLRNEETIQINYILVIVISVCFMSSVWSYSTSSTLVRSAGLAGTTMVGVYIATRFSLREILLLLWLTGVICVIASIVMIIAFPEYGITNGEPPLYQQSYKGIFDNKNMLSANCLIALISFLYCSCIFRSFCMKLLNIIMIFTSLYVIVIADAVTSYAIIALVPAFIVAIVVTATVRSMRFPLIIFCVFAVAILGLVIIDYAGSITHLMARDVTLSNRTPRWIFAIHMIEQRPGLGYGYGVFWDWYGDGIYWDVLRTLQFALHSHNGYLDTLLDIGVLGFIPLMYLLISSFVRSVADVFEIRTWYSTWPLTIVVVTLLTNLTEVTLLTASSLQWCLFVAVTTMQARRSVFARLQPNNGFRPGVVGEH